MRLPGARIGISGWRYAGWRGRFYPEGLPQSRELAYAAGSFNTIELNGSFYSLKRPADYALWHREVPEDFLFAVKGPRFITHMLRLRNVRTALGNFFASGVFAFEEKLGPFLWQLPPTFQFDPERLESFFNELPRNGAEASALARKHDNRLKARARIKTDPSTILHHAIEVRHPSFQQQAFIDLLREQNIALVIADTAGKWPWMEDITADFIYIRLHGDTKIYESGYSPQVLDQWAQKIRIWLSGGQPENARALSPPMPSPAGRDVFVYFDNDAKVYAPRDALRLARTLTEDR
ncbi:MAG: DUF72 domain-containing protein [Woeseia sp.]